MCGRTWGDLAHALLAIFTHIHLVQFESIELVHAQLILFQNYIPFSLTAAACNATIHSESKACACTCHTLKTGLWVTVDNYSLVQVIQCFSKFRWLMKRLNESDICVK